MGAIKITGFIGEQPHILPNLLPGNAAKAAVNVRLDDGGLTPIRKRALEAQTGQPTHQTIYKWGATWLSWPGLVHAVPGPVAQDRLYITGDGVPKLRIGGTTYDLKVPKPAGALTATLGGAGAGDKVNRIYVYTFVTDFGEESEPNPVSNEIIWQPGNTVTLSGFVAAPGGRAISKQRIYRSQTGQTGTFFYLINERAASNANFVDNIAVDDFAEPLPSLDYNTPPDELEGLTALPNGMMAAYVGRDLYFSEPWRPHAWPQKYVQTTDFEIMGLGAVGGTIVVTTKGNPYIAQGAHPSVVQMQKLEMNQPCINKRSVADLGFAIAYASNDGVVAVDGAGAPRLVTRELFNRDGWSEFAPATIVAGQFAGRYLAFFDTVIHDEDAYGALLIDVGVSPYMIRTDARAAATFYEVGTGALYFLETGTDDVFRFDAPGAARETMYWRSKEFDLNQPTNFGAILVRATSTLNGSEQAAVDALIAAVLAANAALIAAGSIGGEIGGGFIGETAIGGDLLEPVPAVGGVLTIGIIADGVRRAQISITNKPQRLPGGFKASKWEVDVAGDQQVREILIGNTMADLQQVPAS